MSKLRYPNKKEIRRQTSIIVERSGIFDDIEAALQYTECKPVRKGKRYMMKAAGVCAALAASCLAVLVSGNLIKSSVMHKTAMTRLNSDDTIIEENASITVNKRIYAQIIPETYLTVCKDAAGNDYNTVNGSFKLPKVYTYGQEVESIATYYSHRWQALSTELALESMSRMGLTINELQFDAVTEERLTAGSVDTAGAILKYECSEVPDGYYYKDQRHIVSFSESYSASYQVQEMSGDTVTYYKSSRIYGGNFNVSTGQILTFQDIFTDYEAGRLELAQAVFSQIRQRYEGQELPYQFNSVESILKNLDETTDWYFGTEGLVVCCNSINGAMKAYSDNVYYMIGNGESYTVPYSQLNYLIS